MCQFVLSLRQISEALRLHQKRLQLGDDLPTLTELAERAIRNSSKSRDIVLDPFGGSGTTLIAAERAGRRARLIELDPKYVDVIVQRWQSTTGGTAKHDATGQSFGTA